MKKVFLAVLLLLSLLPLQVQAAWCQGPIVPCGYDIDGDGEIEHCTLCDIFALINNVLSFILTCLAPIIASLMIVIGGFSFLIAGANPTKIAQGKSILTAVVIGFVIVFVSWVFLNSFMTSIGVASWTGLEEGWWQVKCH